MTTRKKGFHLGSGLSILCVLFLFSILSSSRYKVVCLSAQVDGTGPWVGEQVGRATSQFYAEFGEVRYAGD